MIDKSVIPGDIIGSISTEKPVTDEGREKARALFEASLPKTSLDEEETVDHYIAFKTKRLAEFKKFVVDYGLPEKADFQTWMSLYTKEWDNVEGEGDYLSAAQIMAFAR